MNKGTIALLDDTARVTRVVEPLPGDTFGYFRQETDESLRRRLTGKVIDHDPGDEEPLTNWIK